MEFLVRYRHKALYSASSAMRLKSRIIWLSVALAAVLLAGTIGFAVIDGRSLFEGFYFTLTTLTTIGYGELWHVSRAARIYNTVLIVLGVGVAFSLIGTLTQALIEAELAGTGRRRMERRLAKLEGHYIVCGLGRVGRSVVEQLERRGASFAIIERAPERVRAMLEHDALVVVGDSTKEAVLRQARIERARGLVAALGSDADNIYVTLAARDLNGSLQIIARSSDEEAEKALRRAGADVVVSPYRYSGHRIAQALLQPTVLDFIDAVTGRLGGMHLMIEEIPVAERSPLVGSTIESSGIRQKLGITVLAMRNTGGEMFFNPPPDAALHAGACLIAMGAKEKLDALADMAKAQGQ